MPAIQIIAVEKLKASPLLSLFQEYEKRLRWSFTLTEIDGGTDRKKEEALLKALNPNAYKFIMDERGQNLKSLEFAHIIEDKQIQYPLFQFIIGGADGLSQQVRDQGDLILSFGRQTWPHKLLRVMLIEQIYRAQQILDGHPYHRE
jgi:23S rRNA (pseudouridine1915-N3)-methyltransferase